MASLVVLERIELIPVLELEPGKFSTRNRPLPLHTGKEVPDEWHRYWQESLADSGITGLRPLRPASWHVPTTEFGDPAILERLLAAVFRNWGGIETLSDPDCDPVLNGGLALCYPAASVYIEPGCCCDLREAANWKEAAAYRGSEWQMLWIGHPWLSVRFQAPWLVLSEPHEADAPVERWALSPDELARAVAAALVELERFSTKLVPALTALGFRGDPVVMSLKLAGIGKSSNEASC